MARVKEDQQSEQVERKGSDSGSCCCWQVNSLPSMWYGMLAIALQVKLTLAALSGPLMGARLIGFGRGQR